MERPSEEEKQAATKHINYLIERAIKEYLRNKKGTPKSPQNDQLTGSFYHRCA
jgi:hypothetical protein